MLRMDPAYPIGLGPDTTSVVWMLLLGVTFDLDQTWRSAPVSDMGLERPVADSVEQSQDVLAEGAELDYNRPRELPLEANEADAAEQERALGHDDDDYR
jgi:hypothetical protein